MTSVSSSPALPFSDAIDSNGTVYISGQIGLDPDTKSLPPGGFEAEARQVMQNLGAVLRKYELGYSDLVNVTIYLKTMENYAVLNAVYRTFFGEIFPARVCIAVFDLPLNANVEIAGIAQRKALAR